MAQKKAAVTFASRVDAGVPSHVPPARAARAALEARPDLAGRPFGAIVSLLARHQELPAPADTAPVETPPADELVADAESDDTTAPVAG